MRPGSIITDSRIFSRNFAVYDRIRAIFFDHGWGQFQRPKKKIRVLHRYGKTSEKIRYVFKERLFYLVLIVNKKKERFIEINLINMHTNILYVQD